MLLTLCRSLTLGLWLLSFLVYWQGGYTILRALREKSRGRDSRAAAVAEVLIGISTLVMVAAGVLILLGRVEPLRHLATESVALTGCLLTCLGHAATYVIRFSFLKGFWSVKVGVQDDHLVVDRGPYGLVRHPIYAVMPIHYIGTALVFPTWWSLIGCTVAIGGYMLLSNVEDHFLTAHLKGYSDYKARVRYKLVPWLW